MKKIVVLISGGGSNLQAIIDQCQNGHIDGQLIAVISNKADVYGLTRAAKAGIATITIDHQAYPSRRAFDTELAKAIDQFAPDLIVLAGFMRILTEEFVLRYQGHMLNIHPSLLPKYPGLNTHQRALDAGDTHAGVTVHFVTPELDGGPLIAFSEVPIEQNDDALQLSKKVLAKEHLLYPQVIQWFCRESLTLADNKARFNNETLQNPIKV